MLNFMTKSEPSPTAQFAAVFASTAATKSLVPTLPTAPKKRGAGDGNGNARKGAKNLETAVSFRMSNELKAALQAIADKDERSLAYVLTQACKAFVAASNKKA
jgi:hypothetical protein